MMERAVPVLPVDDLRVAKDFYVGKLGFKLRFEATEDGKNGIMGDWGTRTFGIKDPFGNSIFVIGPIK
jgi:catechol 2,3-dioxygenase-like lactoylglutathione lyase family enzyme